MNNIFCILVMNNILSKLKYDCNFSISKCVYYFNEIKVVYIL